eukprot:g2559.t1
MLALSSSHRGVRLHTYEPEDRAYTSTPTKIGGHALDHVVGVTLAWSRSLNKRQRRGTSTHSQSDRALFAREAEGSSMFLTTLEPSMGRFGGLSVVVHSPRRHHPNAPPATALFMPPPCCPNLAVLPPDTLAPRTITADTDVSSWQQQQRQLLQQYQQRQDYVPEWADENCNKGGEVEPSVAPLDGSNTNAARIEAARSGASDRGVPYRDMATGATGHSGALMAVLLSKLANGGLSSESTLEATVASPASTPQPMAESGAAMLSRTHLLHRSVDKVARGLDDIIGVDTAAPVESGGSRAWKARVDQTPRYSKLRRYDFIRKLGSGSHGTVFLVRKRPAETTSHTPNISGGVLDANKHGSTSNDGGRRSTDINNGSDNHGHVKGSSSRAAGRSGLSRSSRGRLRVLKESPFLPEAVNEARLLLLAGEGGAGGADGVAAANDLDWPDPTGDAGVAAGAMDVGVGGEVTARRSGGDEGKGYQRGEVVQLHDFFVESLGDRALAFLELEYCEGGDLHDLILGGRVGRPAPASNASSAQGSEDGPSVPARGVADRTGSSDGIGGGRSAQGWVRSGTGLSGVARAADVSGLPAAQIGRVALGLSEGLQRLHERGVLHRDLKPANVLLTKNGAVRLADLGVSTCLDPTRPLTENAAGTIPFMAPEVRKFLLGSKVSYSGKADVWALGALVYAMAVGDPAPEALATQTRGRLVSDVGRHTGSEALALVAHRALDPDPSRRPSAHQMTNMLRSCCESEGWLARSSRGLRRGVPPIARL